MMKLVNLNEGYPCERAEKGKDFIFLYDKDGNCTTRFRGISNFSGYSLIDESGKPADFTLPVSDDMAEAAIRAVAMAMAENGALTKPLSEMIIDRAIEIVNE